MRAQLLRFAYMNSLLLFRSLRWCGLLALLLLASSCRQERGERLFEIIYEPIQFDLPAGLSFPNSWVLQQVPVDARYDELLAQTNTSPDEVTAIGGAFARLTAVDGNDFSTLSSVAIRMCPVGERACTEADEVFFLGDLFGRRQTTLRLNPGLRNIKPLIESGEFMMELIITPAASTVTNITCRLEYSLEVVR
jgi:hypothetical protein